MADRKPYILLSVKSEDIPLVQGIFELYDVEGTEEVDSGLKGYWRPYVWDKIEKQILKELINRGIGSYDVGRIPFQNWNAEWEAQFEPIYVRDFCCIRPPFHKALTNVDHDIIIEPKMAFGTGHHATTYQMIDLMEEMDFRGKKVLDYGTGTGLLAILAEKMNAGSISAIDTDELACENAWENIRKNKCSKINVRNMSIADSDELYDVILANINRNVLLHSVSDITTKTMGSAYLLMSGFYAEDLSQIKRAYQNEWIYQMHSSKDNWCCVKFKKKYM